MLYDQQVVLSSLNRYMLRILLSYSISGQLPEGWSVQEIEDYLRSNRLSIHLAVFCFDAPIHSESARHAVQSDLLSRLCVCAKAYKSHIICMAFLPSDRFAAASAALRQQLFGRFGAMGLRVKNEAYSVETSPQTLPASYRKLYAQADAMLVDNQARFNRLIHLYSLEESLNNAVFEVDADEMRRILDEITDIVRGVNGNNHLNAVCYFSFLWRSIERTIFYRIGRRKTSADKLIIDEELYACKDVVSMSSAIHRYLLAYVRDVHLQNTDSYHKVIERTKDYIQERFAQPLSLEDAAREAGVSACHLSKLFKKEEGVSFKQYVTRVRMEKAKFLLSSGKLNIGEVARACGYSDPSYFCKLFKKHWGFLPKEFQLHN